jgi:DNA polymerase-1
MRTLLIDSDILAVASAASVETAYDFEDGGPPAIASGTEEDVEKQIRSRIDTLMDVLNAQEFIVCLSDSSRRYFRHSILPTYKSNRTHGRTPVHLSFAKTLLRNYARVYERPTLEADDVMGILATHPKIVKGEKVIVSDDKDMGTVPGLWYRPRRPEEGVVRTTPDAANYFHMVQTISGDTTDGYAGRPGAGVAKARGALEGKSSAADRWRAVLEVYRTPIGTRPALDEEAALVQARVAKILTWKDYDFRNKRPILWRPPHS